MDKWIKVNKYCIERGKNRISKHLQADGTWGYYAWDGISEWFKPYPTAQDAINALNGKPPKRELTSKTRKAGRREPEGDSGRSSARGD